MTGFNRSEVLVRTSDGRNVTLAVELTFQRPAEVGGEIITVPVGATSDGASIPQAVWSTGLAPFGKHWLAAVLHDAMYRGVTHPRIDNRDEADLIFLEAMRSLGVEERVARLIYNAVSLGGAHAFAEDRA